MKKQLDGERNIEGFAKKNKRKKKIQAEDIGVRAETQVYEVKSSRAYPWCVLIHTLLKSSYIHQRGARPLEMESFLHPNMA